MNGFFYQIEDLGLDTFPGLTFSGWLEVDHDVHDGWYVRHVWLDNGNRNVACPDVIANSIKRQVHDDDEIMQRLRDEAREHNEV
jgi:hypothetical protein